jgi:uroporphyrinogen decarboxylase
MAPMTSHERVANTLARLPVDRSPFVIGPWPDADKRWRLEGGIPAEADMREHFGQDLRWAGNLNMVADLDHREQVIDETDETIAVRDGNGAVLRRFKHRTTTPEHVDYLVKDRTGWDALIRPHLGGVDRRRIPFEAYRAERRLCAERQRFLFAGIVAPFELMHAVCGHENLLAGMALDPDWVAEMVTTYTDHIIHHLEIMFSEEGRPDGVYFFEDLGFKQRPFFSRRMYDEIMLPGHRRLFDFAHAQGCKVMMHSCGFIEPLLPGVIEAGLDCLQGMEAKAGMDLARLFSRFGDRISFCGGIDARVLIANDRAAIDAELERLVRPVLEGGGGYILSSDHSEPPEVSYDTIRYFLDRGLEMSREVRLSRLAS